LISRSSAPLSERLPHAGRGCGSIAVEWVNELEPAPPRPDQDEARRSSRLKPTSRLLLVVAVPDDVGDVLVALLLLLDEGVVVHALVLDLHVFLGALDRLALGRLLALGLRVRFLERDEFGLGGLRRHHLFFRRRRSNMDGGGRGLRSRPRVDRRELQHGVAFRADDRILAEIVEFRAAIAAEALGAELGFRHGSGSLSGSEMRCFTWRVAMAVSIAAKRLAPASSCATMVPPMTPFRPRARERWREAELVRGPRRQIPAHRAPRGRP